VRSTRSGLSVATLTVVAEMAAAKDSQIGISAVITASEQDIVAACTRAVSVLGKRASLSTGPMAMTVHIYPGLVQKLSSVSPTVGIALKRKDENTISVTVRIERYRTSQQRLMLIPVAPKMLVGKGSYMSLVRSLEQELSAIGSGNTEVRRTGI
jgi:hypothetical protein